LVKRPYFTVFYNSCPEKETPNRKITSVNTAMVKSALIANCDKRMRKDTYSAENM
jgi:hypothetical protein